MPIHDGILKRHAEEHIILMEGEQTLDDTMQRFVASGYPENDTFLVVSNPDNNYMAMPFAGLAGILEQLTGDTSQPLSGLPIPPASRVERKDTPESGKAIVDWVASHPRSTLVVIDDNGFVALIANTDMTGGSEGTDSVAETYIDKSGKCPHCKSKKGFTTSGKCKSCGREVISD